MRIKTVHRTLGMITFAAAMIFSYIFWKNHALMYAFFAGFAFFVSGGFFALCDSSDCGKACIFKDLDDDVYTYLGNIDEVHILKYRNKSGERLSFAVYGFTPCDRVSNKISVGASFRKIKEDVVLL